ncbi:MAG TPA: DUF2171 domain-containing protein [Allosphingosinicella sp.]|nr:DUF2171 domain-containing protein [Allosphingosinicella sp.]
MTGKERGPEWQGDDSFGPGWGNQTAHDPQADRERAAGEDFGAGARAGDLTRGGYGAAPGGDGFAIRDAAWHEAVEKIREHMEVRGADGGHVGMVDCLRGEHIVLTRRDATAGGVHHAIPAGWVAKVDDKVHLTLDADEAMARWRTEERSRALFEREDSGSDGPHILDRAFSGTYRDEKK